MIDDELALATEKISQRLLACGPIENIILFDRQPWQLPPHLAYLVAMPGKFFFFPEQLFAGSEPLSAGNNLVVFNCVFYRQFSHNNFS